MDDFEKLLTIGFIIYFAMIGIIFLVKWLYNREIKIIDNTKDDEDNVR